MRYLLFSIAATAVAVWLASSDVSARPTLVIYESQDCIACARLREDVLRPKHARISHHVAMEVIDFDWLGTAGHALAAPVNELPTIVIMQDGRERARLSGKISGAAFERLIGTFWRDLPKLPGHGRYLIYTT